MKEYFLKITLYISSRETRGIYLTLNQLFMSQFDDKLAAYKNEMGGGVDETLLSAVTKSLGPSIYNEDSSRVSCSDKGEMERVKQNFLIGKLGLADGPELDVALEEVCEQLGSSNRNKFRAIFYYHLVKRFKKEAMFA